MFLKLKKYSLKSRFLLFLFDLLSSVKTLCTSSYCSLMFYGYYRTIYFVILEVVIMTLTLMKEVDEEDLVEEEDVELDDGLMKDGE